jgi:methylenetetrahydrofolate dehydrogenase (NADP+)/methenyltetrahydrofolate cyclohydrolase
MSSMPRILDGRACSKQVRAELAARVRVLRERGVVPGLRILLAGDFAPSQVYVRSKEKAGCEVGIDVQVARLPGTVTQAGLRELVEGWNRDPAVHGAIVQLPLPAGRDEHELLAALSPAKDVDGLSPKSLGLLMSGRPHLTPATPTGIIELLRRNDVTIAGRRVVIVGRGELVGKPLALMLLRRGDGGDATVTVCHTRTPDLAGACRGAEILVVAAGRPRLVTGDMVSDGVVVVDAGTNSVDGKLVGDVDFDSVAPKTAAITPVPGGVGPMTVAMLLANVVKAAEQAAAAQ